MEKLIITAAICGMGGTKEDNPAIPYTVEEFVREAKSAYDAGASVIHVHAREDDGSVSERSERFKEIVSAIKAVCPGVIIIEPATFASFDMEELASIEEPRPAELPEVMTIPSGTCNWDGYPYINTDETIFSSAQTMKRLGIKPDLELFDKGMIDTIKRGLEHGYFEQPLNFDFIMGVQIAANVKDLAFMASSLPCGSTWTATGVGKDVWHIAAAAILLGGNVRVGFEDSMMLKEGEFAKSNGELVAKAAELSRMLGREVASPAEARRILGLKR
ncbi:MAG: 3-keto-5-aminohexanoate cleavage protein [Eubacteriales Family XIII. Incertae Sedis bacterium]|nr:MAG: 3-keto-5-aminohexanoate cleavage protein [Clostridiales Family XIII bacterium]PWM66805.1 MAG: 3-keto-5-aminohexanoate cleavage protein [Clostridiales Family XIII bacterium]